MTTWHSTYYDYLQEFQKTLISLPINGQYPKSTIIKLGEIERNGIKGEVFYQGKLDNYVGDDNSYLYGISWVNGDTYYRFHFSAFDKSVLQNNKDLFDKILSTFNFTT